MQILLLNASPKKDGTTKRALKECLSELERLGDHGILYDLGTGARCACLGCGSCKKTGACILGDISELITLAENADGIIFGTPTYFGGAAGNLTSVLSRLCICAKNALRYKPVATVGVGRRGAVVGAIHEVNKFFEFTSSPIVTGEYPCIAYGKDFQSLDNDREGLQNIRVIARNMHWLLSLIDIGRKNGINTPIQEEKILTDISSASFT